MLDSTMEQNNLLAKVSNPAYSRTLIRGRKKYVTFNKELQKLEA